MAIWAVFPEIMWLMRWASGCSTSTSTPGTSSLTSFWSSAMISLRGFPASGLMTTWYSLALGGSACSSSSARPVRRRNASTSPLGFASVFWSPLSLASTSFEAAFDASSDAPAGRVTFT